MKLNEKGGRGCRPPLVRLATWPHRNPAKGPQQLPTEFPPARPAYPAALWPCRETATSPIVTGTTLSQQVRTLHCSPARGPQWRLDTPTLTWENQHVATVLLSVHGASPAWQPWEIRDIQWQSPRSSTGPNHEWFTSHFWHQYLIQPRTESSPASTPEASDMFNVTKDAGIQRTPSPASLGT